LPYWLIKIRLLLPVAPAVPPVAWIGVAPSATHAECSSLSIVSNNVRERWVASTRVNVREVWCSARYRRHGRAVVDRRSG
jgi:hypothetical protein